MKATALAPPRFVRRTQLGANEYRKNFHQIDAEVISAVTSAEADRVTPLMSKIYLRLASAPPEFWERDGVLYFRAGEVAGRPVKASKVLYGLLGVASATTHKALQWMHEQGIIGYFAGKNGAGIRIFLNRATGSIGVRGTAAGKKILPFVYGSNGASAGSTVEPAFNDSFADLEVLETDINPRPPKDGAEQTNVVNKYPDTHPSLCRHSSQITSRREEHLLQALLRVELPVDELVLRLRRELEPSLKSVARQAAAHEHERTREWLESRGLPKAARVAQREAYNVLRKHGVINEGRAVKASSHTGIGRNEYCPVAPHPLSDEEQEEMAQACVALLETKGQSVDISLSEMGAASGGFLLAEDVPLIRAKVENLLRHTTDGMKEGIQHS
jgi:hypothetical protein